MFVVVRPAGDEAATLLGFLDYQRATLDWKCSGLDPAGLRVTVAASSITLGGLLLSALVAGTVLVENVFAWPGLGGTIVSSILDKDYPVVQGIVLVYGAGVLVVNLAVDVTLALLDPRSVIRES